MRPSNPQLILIATMVSLVAAWLPSPEGGGSQVVDAEFQLVQVTDSQSYFVYHFELANPLSSSWAISSLRVDISASSGTPPNLPATGDLDIIPPFDVQVPHAEVGPISPSGWKAIQSPLARLTWTPPLTRSFSGDSVPPGAAKDGFGIRSTYLPDLTQVELIPTTESCCREPIDTTGGERIYALPVDLATEGLTVAPRLMPAEVSIDLVRDQVTAVCSDPLWINDSALCTALADSLDAAEVRLDTGNITGARNAVSAAGDIVYANREPFGPIESNAEWLLRLNLAQLLENLPQPSLPNWSAPVSYSVGDEVSFNGLDYRCRQSHTSQAGWEPPNVFALWERINTGGEWAPQVIYQTGDEAVYQGTAYRAIQGHQSQSGWEPPNQPALWEPANWRIPR